MDGKGRAMAMEILVPNSAVRNLIREDKIHQIYSIMQTGSEKFGMQTLNKSLADLVLARKVSYEDALGKSQNPEELRDLLGRAEGGGGASDDGQKSGSRGPAIRR